MKIKLRRRLLLAGQGCLLLFLCIVLIAGSSSSPSAFAETRVSVMQAVTQEHLPVLKMNTFPSPGTVQEFAKTTLDKLAIEAPFTAWKDAAVEYFPLGPGTHGWLVNVMKGEQRIGYMIITATEDGGYMLSEYGAGTYGLPYSLSELRQFLVQKGLISTSFSGKIQLTALYAPLLPVWKLSIDNQTLFINASVLEILPWSLSKAEEAVNGMLTEADGITTQNNDLTPRSAFNSGGTDDPYENIIWLTSPKIDSVNGGNITELIRTTKSLAFQAADKNELIGAPFMITGYQSWEPAQRQVQAKTNKATIYAASGPEGKRYLPLSTLQANGTLHKLPNNNVTTLGLQR